MVQFIMLLLLFFIPNFHWCHHKLQNIWKRPLDHNLAQKGTQFLYWLLSHLNITVTVFLAHTHQFKWSEECKKMLKICRNKLYVKNQFYKIFASTWYLFDLRISFYENDSKWFWLDIFASWSKILSRVTTLRYFSRGKPIWNHLYW